MTTITDPTLSAFFYYSVNQIGSEQPAPLCERWQHAARLEPGSESPSRCRYTGETRDGIPCTLTWTLAHDTHLLHVALQRPGSHVPETWAELRSSLDQLAESTWSSADAPRPWAATYLYHGCLPGTATKQEAIACVQAPNSIALSSQEAERIDPTPFGWLWTPREGPLFSQRDEGWQRMLVLLTPETRAKRVRALFLEPLTQGLPRIELYLQKGKHHSRQQQILHETLEQARETLQNGMLVSLRTTDFSQIHKEHLELEDLARQLMHFQALKAQGEILLSSLHSNLQSFTEHLERVKLETPTYTRYRAYVQRHIEQLEQDLHNANIVSESTYTLQEIQQSVQAARMERASFLMGGAAAILAAVAIFNSFLDIWSLTVEGTDIVLPGPGVRILLGAVVAIGWSLGSYWVVERRKWRATIALGLGFAAFIIAILLTI